jgi:hypothetical protein
MAKIEFDGSFSDETKQIKIVQNRYGLTDWQITIDDINQGSIFERVGEYYYHDTFLDADDITKYLRKNFQVIYQVMKILR